MPTKQKRDFKCGNACNYMGDVAPTCKCLACSLKWTFVSLINDVSSEVLSRELKLDNYVNSQELAKLQEYKDDIILGMNNLLELHAFLAIVPEGDYDGNRGKYFNAVSSYTVELEWNT